MINYVKVGLEPKIRMLRLVLALKVDPGNKSLVYASYMSNALALLIFESLHRLGDSFFFYLP